MVGAYGNPDEPNAKLYGFLSDELHEASTFTVTSGKDGTFSVPRLPVGPYFVTGTAPDGLRIGFRRVTVEESRVDGLLVRATSPLTGLTAKLEFTKDVYGKAEAPKVRVTLTE